MGGGTFLPGVKSGDIRYERQQAKLTKSLSTLTRLSLVGVTLPSLRGWMDRRLVELVGISDEVLLELVINTLSEHEAVEAGNLRILLTPFMGANHAEKFVSELWELVGKAKQNGGIPIELEEEYEKFLQEEKERKRETVRGQERGRETCQRNNGGNNKGYDRRGDNTFRHRNSRSPVRRSPVPHSPSRYNSRRRSPPRHDSRRHSPESYNSERHSSQRHINRLPSCSPIRQGSPNSQISRSPRRQISRSSRRQISRSPPRRMHAPATPPGSPGLSGLPGSPTSSSYSSDDDVTLQLRERARRLMQQE